MKRIISLVLALVVTAAVPASAAPAAGALVIKIGSVAPSRSPWDKALENIAREWERISNGAIQVKIYPGSIAGSEMDMTRKMRLGVLQGGVFTSMGLSKIERSVTVLNIPFLFHTREEFNDVFDRMKPSFEQLVEAKGFKIVMWTLVGWVNFFTRTPVTYPDDLKKLKINVTQDDAEIEQVWKKMGYEVIPGSLSDLTIQLQSGAADAAYLPPLLAGSGQYFASIPHMLSPALAPLIGGLVMSDKAWESLPAGLRPSLMEAVAAEARGLYEETVRLDAEAVQMMKDNGLVVHELPADILVKWQEAAGRGVQDLIGPVFSKETYDRVVKFIQEFRNRRAR